jgi:YfiH family protein
MHVDWLRPEGLPPEVGAVMSTRRGGASVRSWDTMNLGLAAGDAATAVACNRERFAHGIGAVPVFLRQVHGARVVRVDARDATLQAATHEADASVTTEPGVACTVLVADCLPVLLAAPEGRAVAAAHAGWRGLAGGVVEAALGALCETARCEPAQVRAWLGACIGPRSFEVGADVLRAFGVDPVRADPIRFSGRADGPPGKWLANLPQLARDRLHAAGVLAINGGVWCTVEDAPRFFSYRRDGVTGRMAAAIWIRR